MPIKSQVDDKYLRSAGRDLRPPFLLKLRCGDTQSELLCTEILRVLPGKRLVCFGEWNYKSVVAKIFLDTDSAKRHMEREEKGIEALRQANIKTPQLLFKGSLISGKAPVLCYQRLMDVRSLHEEWKNAKDDEQRLELLSRSIKLIAEQHEAGLKQDDPHLRNFLIGDDVIYAIDGDAVDTRKMGNPLPVNTSMENLGLFFAQLYPRYDYLFQKVFLEYARGRGWLLEKQPHLKLQESVTRQRNRRKEDYLRKIYRECTAFACTKSITRFIVCDRDYYDGDMGLLLKDPDSAVDEGTLLKKGNTSTVAIIDIGDRHFVVKRYNIKGPWHALKRCFRSTRAWVSWRNSHRLTLLGIPTPKPVAIVENRLFFLRSTSYFITQYIDGIDAHTLMYTEKRQDFDLRSFVKRFIELFKSLMDVRISHGDCKATNFIFKNNSLYIADLDAMKEYKYKWSFQKAFRRDLDRFEKNWLDLPEVAKEFCDQFSEFR